MISYRTEIVISPDRYVCIQLPAYVPEGRAVVVIHIDNPEESEEAQPESHDFDRQDIEWWDEFGAADRQG